MNYNYVVFMTTGPFEYMFKDLDDIDEVKIFWSLTQERGLLSRLLIKIHFNKLINLPFKWIWFNGFFKRSNLNKYFPEKRPIVFIVRAGYDYEFFKTNAYIYLKRKYSECKFVMPILDTVASCYKRNDVVNHWKYDINEMKKQFDLIISGNPKDVEKYNLQYYPEPFSTKGVQMSYKREYDVFFIGTAKDRLDVIHNVYKKLSDDGVKCDFWVVGVDKEKQLYDGIKYNFPLKYSDMLVQSCKSKAILEIVQRGTTGFTIRACRALINNQKYITNARGIKNSRYYNPEYILQFDNVDEITSNWVLNDIIVDYKYSDDYSPIELIKYLDNYFGVKDPEYKCKWQI